MTEIVQRSGRRAGASAEALAVPPSDDHLRSPALGPVVVRRVAKSSSVLLVASLGVFMAFVDATIVTIAFPDIARSFPAAGLDGLSWVLNAYNVVFAAFLVAAGRIADLLGRKRVFELGLVTFTGASALCALAPSVELLIAARVLQAIGAAVVVPASLALVLHAFSAQDRTRAVALWAATAALAAGLGPSLGGVLVDIAGWRSAFLINVPIGLAAAFAARRTLVESRAPGKRLMPDLLGAVLFAAAIGALVLAVVKGPEWGWGDWRVLMSFATAVGVGALFARRSARHPAPLIDGALVRIRSLAVANSLMAIAAASYFGLILTNVLFLTTVWDWSVLQAGFAMTPGPFVAAAVAGPVSRLVERVDPRPVIAVGAGFWGAGAAGYLLLAGERPDFLGGWLPATVLAGIGGGIVFPTLSGIAVAAAPGGRFATATALNSVARQVGAAVGVGVLIAVLGSPASDLGDFQRGWVLALGLFATLALGAAALGSVATPTEPETTDLPDAIAVGAKSGRLDPDTLRPIDSQSRLPSLNGAGSLSGFLAAVPVFAAAPAEVLERLAAAATIVRVDAGDVLFHEGEEGENLFIVASGRLEVVRHAGGAEQVLRLVHPGDVLGELAVLTGGSRSATVRARRDSALIRLDRADFEALVRDVPELALSVMRELAVQVRDSRPAESAVSTATTSIAVVGLAGAGADELARELAQALGRLGRTALLTAASADGGAEPAEVLDAHERHHDHVVLAAGDLEGGGRWPEFCLRHADRVLAVTSGGAVPDWVYWYPQLRGCDIVYVDQKRGAGIGDWARVLDAAARYRIEPPGAPGRRATVDATARRLAGRSVGIVLSGGGARGFAHIGVLQELTEAGVVIDRVGGVSCGAWIGALFALGMDGAEIEARCYEDWVRRNPLTDYTVPRTSVIRGHKVQSVFERNLPGLIEDLPRDYYCVSCDLVTGDQVVHRSGPLAVAAAASQCLPGLAPPVVCDGRLLIDGGVINNLPVDVMATRREGPIVAVDVTTRYEAPRHDGGRGPRGSGAGGLWDNDTRRPGLFETISRAVVLGSVDTEEAARRHADLVIRPIEPDVGMLEWHQLDRVRERGRRAARAALQEAPTQLFGL